MDLDSLERKILRVESALILLAIGAIAVADYYVGPGVSLGPLYLIPLSYSALSHRLSTIVVLVVACVVLRQLFGPLGNAADPWMALLRDLGIALVFVVTVVLLRRLGTQRRHIFELARSQRDELAREVDLGAKLQQRLISLSSPPTGELDIAARTEPLRGVNGDYYDFIDLGDRTYGIVIADVAGKGLPAAMLMPALRLGTRSLVAGRGELTRQIGQLNDEFCRTTEPRHYGTLVYVRLELDGARITYVNAGHDPPILVRANGESQQLGAGGRPIGLLRGGDYASGQATLGPGSTLLLYTDGVTEAENRHGEELGRDRLVALLEEKRAASAGEIVQSVFEQVRSFLDGGGPTDDITVIAVKNPL